MTLDGKVATRSGDSQWISGEHEPRARAPLARRVDAVAVGHRHRARGRPAAHRPRRGRHRASPAAWCSTPRRACRSSQLVRTARADAGLPLLLAGRVARFDRRLEAAGVEVIVATGENEAARVRSALDRAWRARHPIAAARGRAAPGRRVPRRRRDRRGARCSSRPMLAGGRHARAPLEGQGVEAIADAARALSQRRASGSPTTC